MRRADPLQAGGATEEVAVKSSALVASVLCLALSGAARAAELSPIAVTSVIVEETLITIRGSNFGDAAPAVALGGHPLDVIGNTREELLAELPAGLAAGSYLLRLSREPNAQPFTLFEVTIGAAGPRGEVIIRSEQTGNHRHTDYAC